MTIQRFQKQLPVEGAETIELGYLGTPGRAFLTPTTGLVRLEVCPQCYQKNIPFTIDAAVCSFCGFVALACQDIDEQGGCV